MTEYQLPKAYDFKSTEPRIYEMWEKNGYFRPSNDPQKPGFRSRPRNRSSFRSRRPMSPANFTWDILFLSRWKT